MDPVKKQMDSMYQAPLQQGGHKTSVIALVVLLIIAILVAVLGFGRINAIKHEAAKAASQTQSGARKVQPSPKIDVSAELQAALAEDASASSNTAEIDAAFK